MTASLCGECGGRLANHRCVDCGTNHESLQQWANRQIVEYRFTYPGCRADRACVARAHDRNCPTAIAEELRGIE